MKTDEYIGIVPTEKQIKIREKFYLKQERKEKLRKLYEKYKSN